MRTKQVSVFLGNEPGRLVDMLKPLADKQIVIHAMSVAEPLAKAGINLEYFYAFVGSEAGKAMVVLKVNDLEMAERVLEKG